MNDVPAIAFGILALLLGILLHRKRRKIVRGGASDDLGGRTRGGSRKIGLPAPVLNRIISVLMFLGGVGLASTFVGSWLADLDFSIGQVTSTAIITIVAVLLGVAVLIDVFDGNGLRPTTYAMICTFPLMWAAAGGSLSWPKAISATCWSWLTGATG
ncbi:hypothetical protein J5X84_02340 [Streptosporangiaceae bacterium NEAU-GS5]|nr:hypothetical protein [Streptosporangiaceae bacterium NEAU-GS5]